MAIGPEHPLEGSKILRGLGYPEELIYAILSHTDYLTDYPRVHLVDKTLYACDELCGFLVACALVRPERLQGMEPKSVRKKLKNLSFAAAVNRDDIDRGATDLGVSSTNTFDFARKPCEALAINSLIPSLRDRFGNGRARHSAGCPQ